MLMYCGFQLQYQLFPVWTAGSIDFLSCPMRVFSRNINCTNFGSGRSRMVTTDPWIDISRTRSVYHHQIFIRFEMSWDMCPECLYKDLGRPQPQKPHNNSLHQQSNVNDFNHGIDCTIMKSLLCRNRWLKNSTQTIQ